MFRLIVALSVLCFASATLNQERIVNGRNANIMEVPYQVSIQTYGSHWCGGSVLTNRWCLTAAHCLVDIIKAGTVSSLSIRIGSSNWIYGGSVKKIEAAINHPNYNPETQDFDVGLLRTAQEIVYSGAVKPVTLITAPLPSGTPVVVSGWGLKHENDSNMPKDLQLVELKSMSRNECGSKTLYVPEQIKESMTCASGDNKDSCQGDSGGPLNIASTCCQVGIVSFGAGCAQPGLPGVYAALYHPLIIEFIKSYARDARFSTSCAQYQI